MIDSVLVRVGSVTLPMIYQFCLFATVGRQGFTLEVLFPFRFLHPPLFIPWESVERCRRVKNFLWDDVAVHVQGFHRRLELGGAAGTAIHAAWKQSREAAQLHVG